MLALRHCLRLFFGWIMLWATAAIVLRVAWQTEPRLLCWGLLGLAPAAAIGVALAVRQTPSPRAVRAALDRNGRLGGLLMAAGEEDIGQWGAQISRVPIPVVRWRSGRQWLLLLASIVFLAAVFLAPNRYLPALGDTALQIGNEMQKLGEKVQVLKQEQIVPPEKAQVLEKDLDRIRQEALGKDPAKTMEAIDHLEQSFNKSAAEAAESAIQQTEAASRAQELAQALADAQGKMDPKQLSEAMKELGQMTEEAAAENKSLADALSDELQKASQSGDFTAEQLKELSKSLEKCKAGERGKIEKMVQAKLVDAEMLAECDKAAAGDEAALLDALGEGDGNGDGKDSKQLADALMMNAGKGGRGGGPPAAMTWSEGVEEKDAAFKEKVLPPAALSSLKKSRLAGISAGDPTAKKAGSGSSGGALGAAQAGGGAAHAQIILPEHEKTVERYFSREKKSNP